METKTRTREQVIHWLKAAHKRQMDWQYDVKQRWTVKQQKTASVEV